MPIQVLITLKGLKPDADEYETHVTSITGEDMIDVDANITAYIYEWRNKYGFYKMKYINKRILPCDN